MNLFRRYYKELIFFAATAAAFFLIFRGGNSIKVADFLFALVGIFILFHAETRKRFIQFVLSHRRYFRWMILLILFFLIGQSIGYFGFDIVPNLAVALNYARVVFNFALFFLIAHLILEKPKFLTYVSLAILVAPVVLLVAYTKFGNTPDFSILEGGRLTGFLENPILLCMWLAVVFLVGMGFFLQAKKGWLKIIILGWLCVIAAFILWSASRAGWLALAFGLFAWALIYLFHMKNLVKLKFLLAGTLFAFGVGYALLPNTHANKLQPWVAERVTAFVSSPLENQYRISLWQNALPVAIKNILGLGLLNSTGLQPKYVFMAEGRYDITDTPSNTFLEIMFYGGIGALLAFLLLLFEMRKSARGVFSRMPEISDLEIAWLLGTPLVLVVIFFNDGFLLRLVWFVFGVTFGVILRRKAALNSRVADALVSGV